MDNEEFKRKLTEVADWKIPDTPRETSLNAKKKRGRKSHEDEYMELREEIFYEEFGGVNPTYPPMLLKLKIQSCACEDCGKVCKEGRKKEKKLYDSNRLHWREKCVTCGMTKNPWTGAFDLDSTKAALVWAEWLRKTNPRFKSKKKTYSKEEVLAQAIKKGIVKIQDNGDIIYLHDSFKEK